jgi:hypothetical protein
MTMVIFLKKMLAVLSSGVPGIPVDIPVVGTIKIILEIIMK